MYIIYNSDGSIYKKYLNEYIQQGNSYVNAIFIAIIGREPGNYALSAFAKLPDKTNITLPTNEGSLTVDMVTYHGVNITITSDATLLGGLLQINAVATDVDDNLITFNVFLTVNETGVASSDPVIITAQEYTNLVSALNNKQNQLTFDSTPVPGSLNPVTSGGVYDVLQHIIEVVQGKVDIFTLSPDDDIQVLEQYCDQETEGIVFDAEGNDITEAMGLGEYHDYTCDNQSFESDNQVINIARGHYLIVIKEYGQYVFDKVENITTHIGDIFIVTALGVPDRWCANGNLNFAFYPMETAKFLVGTKWYKHTITLHMYEGLPEDYRKIVFYSTRGTNYADLDAIINDSNKIFRYIGNLGSNSPDADGVGIGFDGNWFLYYHDDEGSYNFVTFNILERVGDEDSPLKWEIQSQTHEPL